MIDFNKYSGFLKSESIYQENVELYDKLFGKITTDEISDWVITKFANEKVIADGNPIFAVYIESKKIAVRIIQLKIAINKPIFNVWINNNPFEMDSIKELVVSLQLRQDTYEDLSYLLEKFINKNLSNQIIKFLNDKYHKVWNENILAYTIKKHRQDKKIAEILNNDFADSDFTNNKLKSYAVTIKNIFPIFLVDYKFQNQELNDSIKAVKHATENLYQTLTIQSKIDGVKKKHTQTTKFHYCPLPGSYKLKLKKNKDKLKEELNEIEQLIS